MTSLSATRARYPETRFVTRALPLPDGTTRMIVLAAWYWEKLDLLLAVDTWPLEKITGFCVDLAERAVREEGWTFDHALQELLMYYIYRNHAGYRQVAEGIANDSWEDCFAS